MGYHASSQVHSARAHEQRLFQAGLCIRSCGRPRDSEFKACKACRETQAGQKRAAYAAQVSRLDPSRRAIAQWPDRRDKAAAPQPCRRCGLRGEHECLRGVADAGLGAWQL